MIIFVPVENPIRDRVPKMKSGLYLALKGFLILIVWYGFSLGFPSDGLMTRGGDMHVALSVMVVFSVAELLQLANDWRGLKSSIMNIVKKTLKP